MMMIVLEACWDVRHNARHGSRTCPVALPLEGRWRPLVSRPYLVGWSQRSSFVRAVPMGNLLRFLCALNFVDNSFFADVSKELKKREREREREQKP
jgi:hypothetical protein